MFYSKDIVLAFIELIRCPILIQNIQDVCTVWRIAIRRVWWRPLRTHNNIMAYVAAVMEQELWVAKRCIQFIKMSLMSENNTICTITNMDRYCLYSIMGVNRKRFNDKYCMDEINMDATWKCMCENNEDRAFSAAAANLCNSIPVAIRLCNTVTTFKICIKSYLFNLAYPINQWFYQNQNILCWQVLSVKCDGCG